MYSDSNASCYLVPCLYTGWREAAPRGCQQLRVDAAHMYVSKAPESAGPTHDAESSTRKNSQELQPLRR